MEKLGLAVNVLYGLLLCMECQAAIVPSQAKSHLGSAHSVALTPQDLNLLKQVCATHSLTGDLLSIIKPSMLHIEGLKAMDGFSCCLCTKVYATKDSLLRHHLKDHPSLPRPRQEMPVRIQRLSNGQGALRSWFPMSEPPTVELSTDAQIIKDVAERLKGFHGLPKTAADIRNVSPWLRTTGWHVHIKGHDIDGLRSLASHPTRLEFPWLKQALVHLLFEASDLMETTHEIALQMLNTPHPERQVKQETMGNVCLLTRPQRWNNQHSVPQDARP